MTSQQRSGGCLCGAIEFWVDGQLRPVLHCHCEHCRRFTGNFVAATGCPTANLRVTNESMVRWHQLEHSRYGFCSRCGSSLFWLAADSPDHTSIMAGSLDEADGLELHAIWFSSEAQSHNLLDPSVDHFTGNGPS